MPKPGRYGWTRKYSNFPVQEKKTAEATKTQPNQREQKRTGGGHFARVLSVDDEVDGEIHTITD